ncbi:serine/threonine protein kinase [Spirosoma sp. BT702]|uniref:Serine/threonine protein kinase n=1 Tax=Spirosoma profusum TaxID=2771354 RepID=A0A926XVF2_9BACT|nr:serine/threonine-protein kinase [Spirosoma profusum]MBD2700456.1 serine/threonine protein kinase [Spirosoma profusum]
MSPSHPLLYRVVAGYRLTDYVGAGGMGEVFKATHLETGRLAAVKVLYRPEFTARFRNEASVQASVSHPNIAALYEFNLLDERPALVIEWVEGQSLDEVIRRRDRLSNDEATRIIKQLANAMAHLHQMGIIHRDLKPSNIRIQPNGQVKLVDFGIAKGRFTPQLTKVGHAVGTTEFMAPEQFRGQVDAKSDVWALGVLLYEMTTGHLPFDAANPLLLRHQIERGQFTRPQMLNPALSQELATLISSCLNANPIKRPAAADMTALLGKPADSQQLVQNAFALFAIPLSELSDSIHTFRYWLVGLVLGIGLLTFLANQGTADSKNDTKEDVTTGTPVAQFEQIQVEVLNADYDIELVSPDGTVQTKEPFMVKRTPGEALPITIRHQGVEQQFTIDPEVQNLYQCYFDR